MVDHRPSGWIGTVLQNKWRIEAKIARGGVATVFRATHRRGQIAAIKIMHPEYSRNPDVRSRFLREGYAANKVGHPGVVRVLDDDVTEDGSAYIVMELLEHGELLETMRETAGGRLPVAEVVRVCDQVLDVLAAAHEKGIIHRDIKPDNIFVLADGNVKVLDFGIAHIKQAASEHEPTATGLLLGTPEFMSPEQALGKRGHIDAQSDIYGIGATMFTLLSGEAVHVYDALSALLFAASSRQARSLVSAAAAKELPRELIAVVDKALALEKARRWPSARAMQEALRKAVPQVAQAPIARDKEPSLPPIRSSVLPPPARTPRGGTMVVGAQKSPAQRLPLPPRAPIPLPSRPPSTIPRPVRPPPPSRPAPAVRIRTSDSPTHDLVAENDASQAARDLEEAPTEHASAFDRNPWSAAFADGNMEGPTVATRGSPRELPAPMPALIRRRPEPLEPLEPIELLDNDLVATRAVPRDQLPPTDRDSSPVYEPAPEPRPAPLWARQPQALPRPQANAESEKHEKPWTLTIATVGVAVLVILCAWVGGCLMLRAR